ncbi:hypothetical protein HAX54_039981, partial [Datura stramonium]|nr:hypothetical protein [Datura stramonium]
MGGEDGCIRGFRMPSQRAFRPGQNKSPILILDIIFQFLKFGSSNFGDFMGDLLVMARG